MASDNIERQLRIAVDKVPARVQGPYRLYKPYELLTHYTIPENPMNAMASNPAVTSAMGVPFMP